MADAGVLSLLPKEIWLEILHHVPVRALIEVDRFFLDVWMDQRWKEVVIAARLPTKVERLYERLKDPFVGERVKRLKIELSQCSEEEAGRQTPRPVRMSSSDTLNFKNFTSKFTDGLNLKKRKGTPPPSPSAHDPFLEGLNSIIQIINFLPNVVDLSLEVWNRPDRLAWDINRLFNAIWDLAHIGPNLTHLSIDSDLEGYRILVEQCNPSFKELKELDITLINNFNAPSDRLKDTDTLLNAVTPFIQSLAPNLEALTLRCIASTSSYSSFATCLAQVPFPHLISCSLEFQHPNLPDPAAVKGFLSELAPNLRKFGLRIRFTNDPPGDVGDLRIAERPLGAWLVNCLSTEERGDMLVFSHLQELDLSPTHTDEGMDVLSSIIRAISPTLQYLTLRDCYFSAEELHTFVHAATNCRYLKYLKMCVAQLQADSLDPLLSALSELEGLWLNVGDVSGSELEISHRCYYTSKLRDLSLCDKDGLALESRLLREVGDTLPFVRSFFNLGHTDIEDMKGKAPPSPPRVRRYGR